MFHLYFHFFSTFYCCMRKQYNLGPYGLMTIQIHFINNKYISFHVVFLITLKLWTIAIDLQKSIKILIMILCITERKTTESGKLFHFPFGEIFVFDFCLVLFGFFFVHILFVCIEFKIVIQTTYKFLIQNKYSKSNRFAVKFHSWTLLI